MNRWMMVATVVLALLALAAGNARADGKMVVIVLYFDNNTAQKEYDPLQKGLADMLVTDLSEVDELQVVEREKLQQLVDELKLQRTRFFAPETAQKLGKGLGARYAVTGSFVAIEPSLRIDIRLVEVATGKVLMADKVSGAKDRFLELEQQLAAKFIAGLHLKLARPAQNGPGSVATLLEYSKGVDAADRGDLRAASRHLAEVVRGAPDFKLAEDRYAEVMQRITAAEQKRATGLSDNVSLLTAHADQALRKGVLQGERKDVQRRLGYRLVRALVAISRVKTAAAKAPVELVGYKVLPRAAWPAALAAMKEYVGHMELFLQEQKACLAARPADDCSPELDDKDDKNRGKELGVDLDSLDFHYGRHPQRVRRMIARLIVLGDDFQNSLRVRPSLYLSDPRAWGPRATALMDAALTELEQGPVSWRESDMFYALGEFGDIQLLLGRKMQAIARWQSFLDRYPKDPKFGEVRKRMEEALGMSKEETSVRALAKDCNEQALTRASGDLAMSFTMHLHRTLPPRDVGKLLDAVFTACKPVKFSELYLGGHYPSVAEHALLRGDCDYYAELRRKILATDPQLRLKDRVDKLDGVCGAGTP